MEEGEHEVASYRELILVWCRGIIGLKGINWYSVNAEFCTVENFKYWRCDSMHYTGITIYALIRSFETLL